MPKPRDRVTTKALHEFGVLRTEVLTRIRAAKQG
jgi:hypothetical protein